MSRARRVAGDAIPARPEECCHRRCIRSRIAMLPSRTNLVLRPSHCPKAFIKHHRAVHRTRISNVKKKATRKWGKGKRENRRRVGGEARSSEGVRVGVGDEGRGRGGGARGCHLSSTQKRKGQPLVVSNRCAWRRTTQIPSVEVMTIAAMN